MRNCNDIVVTSAPGKVIIFGEHAVVYGKTAIAGSLGLRCYSKVEKTDKNTVQLILPDIHMDKSFSIEELKELKSSQKIDINNPEPIPNDLKNKLISISQPFESFAMEQATLSFLYLYLCISTEITGIRVEVKSYLPVGAGLGSSAAYGVSLVSSLLCFFNHIEKDNFKNKDTLKLINDWAFIAEKIAHGNPSGIDNSVSTYGRAQAYTKGNLTALESFNSFRFILTNTNVPKNTKVQVQNVRNLYDNYPSVINPILDSIHNIGERCKELFTNENDGKKIIKELKDMIDVNHYLLCSLNVGHEKIEQVRQITKKYSLHTKITGAGGGGCMLTFVPNESEEDTILCVKNELKNNHFTCYDTTIGGDGVLIHQMNNEYIHEADEEQIKQIF
ncbi:mevalonate kinase-like protein [Piromyces finnis]|uniref:Mevalonate kinase n=1 Tax=Piromyces finnis TaxID=1754191 RepID=A0A1Y1VME1_9FUNG|nr:mevalonate kinase-like protein [Piromyces finnis]|eukprot:ORX59064.1 mevalonate kinase-like protein [Piromyces finnis]